jgi:hypothetical protein
MFAYYSRILQVSMEPYFRVGIKPAFLNQREVKPSAEGRAEGRVKVPSAYGMKLLHKIEVEALAKRYWPMIERDPG